MLKGLELGEAIRAAMQLKKVKQAAVAKEFGITQPSVSEWLKYGRVDKGHINHLVTYFSDVVGADHWGLEVANTNVDSQAQPVSLPKHIVAPGVIPWRGLTMGKLPESFITAMPDDSMAPEIAAGAMLWFDRTQLPAKAPDWVLLHDEAGNWYVRAYKERRPGHWEAHATNGNYLPLDSIRDGLTVVAIYMGSYGRRGA